MLISCGNIIRPGVLGVTVFSILISKVILCPELESTTLPTRSEERTTKSTRTVREESAEEDDPPPTGASLAEACYAYVHNFTYSAIVSYNMNRSQASKWYVGRDKKRFLQLAANLTRTIMKLVEEMDQVGAMFSVHKEVPTEMNKAAETKCTPIVKPADEEAPSQDSSTVVCLLVLLILALVSYTGFLTYQIETKYKNSGSGILIEDR